MQLLIIFLSLAGGFLVADLAWGLFRCGIKIINIEGNFESKEGYWCRFGNKDNLLKFGFIAIGTISKIMRKPPIWCFPPTEEKIGDRIIKINREELGMTVRSFFLLKETKYLLNKSEIDFYKKQLLKNRLKKIPKNIQYAVWKLYRIRRIKALIKEESEKYQSEALMIEEGFILTMKESMEALTKVTLLLMKIKKNEANQFVKRSISELDEINHRLKSYISYLKKMELKVELY